MNTDISTEFAVLLLVVGIILICVAYYIGYACAKHDAEAKIESRRQEWLEYLGDETDAVDLLKSFTRDL